MFNLGAHDSREAGVSRTTVRQIGVFFFRLAWRLLRILFFPNKFFIFSEDIFSFIFLFSDEFFFFFRRHIFLLIIPTGISVRETGCSRHHRGTIKDALKTF